MIRPWLAGNRAGPGADIITGAGALGADDDAEASCRNKQLQCLKNSENMHVSSSRICQLEQKINGGEASGVGRLY